ncbi:hypothetical protein BpHYR1_053707 [Brachionus plicatilis]|uniref:Uncharacterized protein n=1 Tax=Brachionus plicatilis TaxID=10195 RepID=A0A3M7P1J8_BRAPC|nr:hypothetical protein BpHYR1_053707 [Brachionus plicatilis]
MLVCLGRRAPVEGSRMLCSNNYAKTKIGYGQKEKVQVEAAIEQCFLHKNANADQISQYSKKHLAKIYADHHVVNFVVNAVRSWTQVGA